MVKFRCGCGQKIGVPESYIGHLVRCPRCARALPVPEEIDVPVVPVKTVRPDPDDLLAPETSPPEEAGAEPTFSFNIRSEALAEGGDVGDSSHRAADPFSSTEFSTEDWEAGSDGSDGEDFGLSMTGLASMIDEPDESLHLESEHEIEAAPAADHPHDDGRGLEDLLGVDEEAHEAQPPASSEQVTDLLRDLSAGAAPILTTEPAPLPEPRYESAAVQVRQRRSSPKWGTLVAGVLSLLAAFAALGLCGLPQLTRFAIPVAAAGVLLALAGMIVGAPRRPSLGLPLAGAVLGTAGIGLPIAIACGIAPRIDLRQTGAARFTRPAIASGSIVPVARAGNVEVRVNFARVVRPAVYNGRWDSAKTSDRPCLQISFALRNLSKHSRIEYRPWAVPRGGEGAPSLVDSNGDPLKLMDVSPLIPVGRATGSPVYLEPGKTGQADVLLFEVPPASAQGLELQLPGANVGVPDATLHLQIPAEIVKR